MSTMRELRVALGERSYPILVGADALADCPPLAQLAHGRPVAVVSDTNVAPLHAYRLSAALSGAAARIDVTLPAGETHKGWASLDAIFDALLSARFDRDTLVVALGGGVVGDIAGFAAAVYQRGVDFVQVPTTLLAMVDSSVGGKTAINHPLGKNMIGAFHQPRLVVADLSLLGTLPVRELSAGLAEVIKHGAIADDAYLARVERDLPRLLAGDTQALADAVARSCEIKASVVERDEREGGLRAILNFGHTFGHAIEAGEGYGAWLHGEAVGCGMVLAADLSARAGLVGPDTVQRIRDVVASARLPVVPPRWPFERWVDLMSVDKKAQQGTPRFVLLDGPGSARLTRVPDALLRATLEAAAA